MVEEPKLLPLVTKLSESAEDTLKTSPARTSTSNSPTREAQSSADEASAMEVDDAPVVKFIQKMLLDAINDGASDIHFEPTKSSTVSGFRVDGVLREVATPPLVIKDKIASRIKVISRLNIAENGCRRTDG